MWNCLSGNEKVRKLKLKHSDLSKALITSYLPKELKFDYLMSSFRRVVEHYEVFDEMELEEIVRRTDILHFNNWFDEEYNERLKKEN